MFNPVSTLGFLYVGFSNYEYHGTTILDQLQIFSSLCKYLPLSRHATQPETLSPRHGTQIGSPRPGRKQYLFVLQRLHKLFMILSWNWLTVSYYPAVNIGLACIIIVFHPSIQGITYTAWRMMSKDESGLFIEIEFLDIAANYGQALVMLILFGLDPEEILVPAVRYIKQKWWVIGVGNFLIVKHWNVSRALLRGTWYLSVLPLPQTT